MARFSLFRRGKARGRQNYVAADVQDPPLQRRRAKSESSRGSSSFDPSEYTLNTNDFNANDFFEDDADLERMRDWFFRKSMMDSASSRTDSSFSTSPRRVHDLDRGPSDYGSTLGGGKDIEELAALNTRVLALAPSDQIEGWDKTTDGEEEGEATVRPVVVKAIELSRKKFDTVDEKEEEESEDDGVLEDGAPIMRERTWGRPLSALDAIFGTNKPKKPLSNEVSPDDAKIVRVLSVEGSDSQENKHRMSWMRMRKSPPPVYKLEPQVEGKVVAKGRSGLDSSVASWTTGTSDNYTTTTVSSGSSNESGYTGDYGSLPTGSEKFIDMDDDDDDDDFSDNAMKMGGCVGGGCNPVAPCRTVAGELSYFVNELMDQEIVLKEDSIFNMLMFARNKASLAEKPRKKGKKRRGSKGNTAGRRAGYCEFS